MDKKPNATEIPESGLSRFLFANMSFAWFWAIVRLYVGWEWLSAGIEKVQSPVWVGSKTGVALHGFLVGALAKTGGAHPQVQGWYAQFLTGLVMHNLTIFSYLVSYGEVLVGIALILGIFTGIAAFFGAFMNMNYLLAGTVSTNPILFVLELLLIFASRTAGWWGLDRFILPLAGIGKKKEFSKEEAEALQG
ncbi:DoxX family membrane protein [Patescibacteria group bacterium]|nr:DoxX family membrane protein [Patescibacteria group bacterium]MCL5010035.1 DoxX family membrane protein [Patescibacteria group bacterium]